MDGCIINMIIYTWFLLYIPTEVTSGHVSQLHLYLQRDGHSCSLCVFCIQTWLVVSMPKDK